MGELITGVSVWAVLIAALLYFVLGFVWYSVLFTKKWMALREINVEDIEAPNPVIFLWTFLLQLIAVLTLAVFLQGLDIHTAIHGAMVGFGAGAGFLFTLAGSTAIFANGKLPLHLIDYGYHVVALAMAGAILGGW